MFHHIQFHPKIIFCIPTPCYFGMVSIWWQLWRLMSECSQFFVLGDPRILYNSVHNHLFTLPDDFYVYPAHDYKGKKIRSRCSLFVELFSEKKFIESQLRICFHYFATPLAPLLTILFEYLWSNKHREIYSLDGTTCIFLRMRNSKVDMKRSGGSRNILIMDLVCLKSCFFF